tara:strand:+ start:720 stop:1553 length:834 start_codon:yes stop_codon:yes gene_type:complete
MIEFFEANYILFFVTIMFLTAIPVGFFAGLFGIGGGLITVPFLFFIFETLNIEKQYLMHLAVGTSFSIIIPTSIVSVLTHRKHKSVDVNIIKTYGIFVISGVLIGTIFAALMKTKFLLMFFSIVVYFLGTYLLLLQEKVKEVKKNFGFYPKIIFGFISGFISAPMGIGGAIMNVPVLRYFGYPINIAIGSAAAVGFIIALFGAIGFLASGSLMQANLPLSLGFINIPTFLIFVPITTFMARIGANTAHKINKIKLQKLFGIFLYVVGAVFLYRYLNI